MWPSPSDQAWGWEKFPKKLTPSSSPLPLWQKIEWVFKRITSMSRKTFITFKNVTPNIIVQYDILKLNKLHHLSKILAQCLYHVCVSQVPAQGLGQNRRFINTAWINKWQNDGALQHAGHCPILKVLCYLKFAGLSLQFDVVWERALMETSAGYFPHSIKIQR